MKILFLKMKIVLSFAIKELKLLRKTILILGVILSIFVAILFSVISIREDLSESFMSNLDQELGTESISIYHTTLDDIKKTSLKVDINDYLFQGEKKSITNGAVFENEKGDIFKTEVIKEDGNHLIYQNFSGTIVYLNSNCINRLTSKNDSLTNGKWITDSNEINMSNEFASYLGVKVSDFIYLDNIKYQVVGIYDYKNLHAEEYNFGHYFISMESIFLFDKLEIIVNTPSLAYPLYKQLEKQGFNCDLSYFYRSYIENIKMMEAILFAISMILFVVVAIIIYSMISMILVQRRVFISQLKLLGTNDKTIMQIYLSIILLVIFATTIISSFLSYLFKIYILDLASTLFEFEFTSRLNLSVPVIYFFATAIIVFLLYFIVNYQTKTKLISQMIRKE